MGFTLTFFSALRKFLSRLLPLFLVACSLAWTSTVNAVPFTADAVQVRDGQTTTAKMYWSGNRVRFEYFENGWPVIQIYDTDKDTVVWLNPQSKTYAREKLPPGFILPSKFSIAKGKFNPCKSFVDAECTFLKTIKLDDRKADKWLITLKRLDQELHIFQWIDKHYKIPLRQENPDGSVMQMNIQAGVKVNRRKVDRLNVTLISAQGTKVRASQWYDPELEILIREEFSNGGIDEMQNIRVEAVDNALFQVPEAYRQHQKSAPADVNAGGAGPSASSELIPDSRREAFLWTETRN